MSLIHGREPPVNCVIGFCYGVAIHLKCNDSEVELLKGYNSHTKDTICNNVFAFSPTGKIFYAALNYPGSWHDSQVSANLICRME